MPAWVETAWNDYAKRLPADCALELREVKPEPRTSGKTPAQMMAAEARRIEAAIPAGALRLALDERGRDLTTMALTQRLKHWLAGGRDAVVLMGGLDGHDKRIKNTSDAQTRVSSLPLPDPPLPAGPTD